MADRSARVAEEVSPGAERMESSCCSQSANGSGESRGKGAGVDSDRNGLKVDASGVDVVGAGCEALSFGGSGTGHSSKRVTLNAAKMSEATNVMRILFCTSMVNFFLKGAVKNNQTENCDYETGFQRLRFIVA